MAPNLNRNCQPVDISTACLFCGVRRYKYKQPLFVLRMMQIINTDKHISGLSYAKQTRN